MAISTPMLVTFIVYIFGMVLIGFIAWRSTKTLMIIFSADAVWGHL
jgi:sodium/proline symporter